MKVEIRLIKVGSKEHKLQIKLRSKILREPLGLKYSEADLIKEASDFHLGVFVDSKLIACLLLSPLSKKNIKMRQVAVDSKAQGLGIGKKLVVFSETLAKEMGFIQMELNARENVVPFYLGLGYKTFGETFTEVTIPHRKMKKALA